MTHHLAQLNIARARFDIDDPGMAEFVDNLDRINGLGDSSPGWIWRHQNEDGNATTDRIFDDPNILLNLTVWESIDALKDFVYRTEHIDFLRRRREWFLPLDELPVVTLWWIPSGTLPTLAQAKERVEHLQEHGPSAEAFTFREPFPPPDGPGA